jgi:hypothetical protein
LVGEKLQLKLFAKLICSLAVSLLLVACSSQEPAKPRPDSAAILQALPAADPAKYEHIRDMKNWRNPYLIVRTDGVALYDSADSAEIILKTDDLLAALAKLPASNWPYGRVVAAQENGVRASKQDGVAIRRNKGIVGGILEGAHIAVEWVPSA